jgi:hypothetical protein
MAGRAVKGIALAVSGGVLLALGGVGTLVYLKTGDQYYSVSNLEECKNYTNDQAKEAVLSARLKQPNGWKSWEDASKVANQNGIRFIDNEIKGPDKIWLIPFYDEKIPDKKQFGMLDCGTLTVEFASE